jgi:hypothetical protein
LCVERLPRHKAWADGQAGWAGWGGTARGGQRAGGQEGRRASERETASQPAEPGKGRDRGATATGRTREGVTASFACVDRSGLARWASRCSSRRFPVFPRMVQLLRRPPTVLSRRDHLVAGRPCLSPHPPHRRLAMAGWWFGRGGAACVPPVDSLPPQEGSTPANPLKSATAVTPTATRGPGYETPSPAPTVFRSSQWEQTLPVGQHALEMRVYASCDRCSFRASPGASFGIRYGYILR